MFFLRPAREDDLPELMRLAGMTGAGFTSLNPDEDLLRKRLALSEASFADTLSEPKDAHYLFALEAPESGRLAGVCGILAAVGQHNPFYSYRVGLEVNAAKTLNIFNQVQTLYLCSDYTGAAEIGSLFLDPDYRRQRIGRLLSRARFLFLAEFRDRFAEKVIAEMRGVSDGNGYSPFWESLGEHFLAMDFTQADYLSGRDDNSFIAELMPRHPIYVPLLSPQAQDCIGQVHSDSTAARRILEAEGFRFQSYVDIFDAGPTLEVRIDDIRSVRKARRLALRITKSRPEAPAWLVANTALAGFRCTIAPATIDDGERTLALDATAAAALGLAEGQPVRACPL
jgi:arginine N-succinyltransferase